MGKVSERLHKSVDDFLELAPDVTAHMQDRNNPHEVTKEQVNLGNVDNVKQATKTELDTLAASAATKTELAAHTGNKNNPHGVTKAQVGLGSVDNVKQASKTEFDALNAEMANHKANKSNPHAVTKAQVGLGSVDNVKQASKTEFDAHTSGAATRHTADSVDYAAGKTVRQKIDELIVDGGGGTMNHAELLNREAPNQHPMGAISGLEGFKAPIATLEYSAVTTGTQEIDVRTSTQSPYVNNYGDAVLEPGQCCTYQLDITGVTLFDGQYSGHKVLNSFVHVESRGVLWAFADGLVTAIKEITKEIYVDGVEEGKPDESDVTVMFGLQRGAFLRINAAPHPDIAEEYKTRYWRGTLTLTNLHDFSNEGA